jgi:hypothetical protein
MPAVEVKLHRDGLRRMLRSITGRRERVVGMGSLVMAGWLLLLAAESDGARPPEAEPW